MAFNKGDFVNLYFAGQIEKGQVVETYPNKSTIKVLLENDSLPNDPIYCDVDPIQDRVELDKPRTIKSILDKI